MSEFQRQLGLLGIFGLALLWLVIGVVSETDAYLDRLESKANRQEQVFHEVSALADRLAHVRDGARGQGSQQAISSLLPWLEKETTRANLAGHVREIAPLTVQGTDADLFREKATLGMEKVSMVRAVRFLHQLEAVDEIRVVRGDLKRADQEVGGVTLFVEIGLL